MTLRIIGGSFGDLSISFNKELQERRKARYS